jgi:hypothetical protein
MPNREEIDSYFAEQWKARRVGGDWQQTANEFWKFANDRCFWKFSGTWKSVADGFITKRKNAMVSKVVKKDSKNNLHTLHVCTLCWRVRAGEENDKRKEDDKLAECKCDMKANTFELWQTLDKCWRFASVCFCSEHVPTAFTVAEQINRVRTLIINRHGDEYAARTRPWFDAIGTEAHHA